MTPEEFGKWFEGFSKAIDDAPTPKQWADIKAKVGELVNHGLPPGWLNQHPDIASNVQAFPQRK